MSKIRLELGNKEMPQVKSPTVDPSTVISTVIESMAIGMEAENPCQDIDVDAQSVSSTLEAELRHSGVLELVDNGVAITQRLYDVCISAPTSPLATVVLQNLEELSDLINSVRVHVGLDKIPLRELGIDFLEDVESPQLDLPFYESASLVDLRVDPRFFQTSNSTAISRGFAAVLPLQISMGIAVPFVSSLVETISTPDFPEVALFASGFDDDVLDYFSSVDTTNKCRIVPVSVTAPSVDAFNEFVAVHLGMEEVLRVLDRTSTIVDGQDNTSTIVDVQLFLSPQEYLMFSSDIDGNSDNEGEVVLDTVQ